MVVMLPKMPTQVPPFVTRRRQERRIRRTVEEVLRDQEAYLKRRSQRRSARYGIDPETAARCDEDAEKCDLCGISREQVKFFCLDHCHKTGRPRGMLCSACNIGLGHLERFLDRGLLEKSLDFIASARLVAVVEGKTEK
jgi:hypothetical protein